MKSNASNHEENGITKLGSHIHTKHSRQPAFRSGSRLAHKWKALYWKININVLPWKFPTRFSTINVVGWLLLVSKISNLLWFTQFVFNLCRFNMDFNDPIIFWVGILCMDITKRSEFVRDPLWVISTGHRSHQLWRIYYMVCILRTKIDKYVK